MLYIDAPLHEKLHPPPYASSQTEVWTLKNLKNSLFSQAMLDQLTLYQDFDKEFSGKYQENISVSDAKRFFSIIIAQNESI